MYIYIYSIHVECVYVYTYFDRLFDAHWWVHSLNKNSAMWVTGPLRLVEGKIGEISIQYISNAWNPRNASQNKATVIQCCGLIFPNAMLPKFTSHQNRIRESLQKIQDPYSMKVEDDIFFSDFLFSTTSTSRKSIWIIGIPNRLGPDET